MLATPQPGWGLDEVPLLPHRCPHLELVIRAEQKSLLIVTCTAKAVGPGKAVCAATPGGARLQRGLLCVLLVGRGEVVDGVLHDVMRVHGLFEAAGDALHGGTAACREGRWGMGPEQEQEEDLVSPCSRDRPHPSVHLLPTGI